MPHATGPSCGGQDRALTWALLNLIQCHTDTTSAPLTRRLIQHCLDLLPVDSVGVILVGPAAAAMKAGAPSGPNGGAVEMAASSDEALRRVEVYEIETAQGPCIEALRTCRPHRVADFTAGRSRWPGLALRATAAGYRAMWAEPLCHDDHAVGVINLYRRATGSLDAHHQERAQTLARAATTGLLMQRTLTDCLVRVGQLQQALSTRVPIEQAKGILAVRLGLSPNAAFEVLRGYARAHRMRLYDLARALVDDPAGPWPPPSAPIGRGR
ncbi:GAF and ANTAR domain-containing protein [Streptomyces sp. NPDC000151]|uniref:GAF and ANTAR domain-containing protein n=1 Tax=Streptomyces sp. NPDC000151 TaxID=3154244 RepID=UPI00332DF84B